MATTTKSPASKASGDAVFKRMQAFETALKAPLVEREEEAFLLTLALLSREHMAQIGGAGIAKSMLGMRATKLIEGASIFDLQFFKGTVPEEVFGPLDVGALSNGVFRRNIEDYLPAVHVAHLDEWWKSNSMILNGSLRIMLERLYKNNGSVIECPLITGIISSNELPERSQPELQAIRDRILITKMVQPVRASVSFRTMLDGFIGRVESGDEDPDPVISLDDLFEAQKQVRAITVGPETKSAVERCWHDAKDNALEVSDRRFLKGVVLLKAKAYLAGRKETLPEDLTVWQHTLWVEPDDIPTAHAVTLNFASEFERAAARFRQEFEDVIPALSEVRDMLGQDPVDFQAMTPKAAKANSVLKGLSEKVKEQTEKAESSKRDTRALDDLLDEITSAREFIRKEALGMD